MIPKIIHQVHLGAEPSQQLLLCMVSVRVRNPAWSYILWDEDMIGSFGGETMDLVRGLESPAAKSNFIRLMALNRFGGIYLDTDCECLEPLEKLRRYSAFAAMQDGDRICNAVMSAEPDHPWITWQIRNWWKFDQQDPASGVYLATAAPRDGLTLIPTEWCYPFMYDVPAADRKPHPDSLIMHHWASSWKKSV